MKRNLMQLLTTPSKVASNLEWKKVGGSVLAIDIGSDLIGLAVATHPSAHEPVQKLAPLEHTLETNKQGNRKSLSSSVVEELQDLVNVHDVCSFVVSWPLQEAGRCGASCGKVLHTLDSLLDKSSTIITPSRPLCLWGIPAADKETGICGPHSSIRHSAEDVFGRDPMYGQTPSPQTTLHKASEKQYAHHDCSSAIAAQVWDEFCQMHWPELYQEQADYDDFSDSDMIASAAAPPPSTEDLTLEDYYPSKERETDAIVTASRRTSQPIVRLAPSRKARPCSMATSKKAMLITA